MPESARGELLVVDGYNVIFKSSRYMGLVDEGDADASDPFDRARELLVSDVATYAQGRYEPVVVFDAAGNLSPERPDLSTAGVRVVFSQTGESADSVIERLVTESRHQMRSVTVVTSDNTIRATVGGIPVTRLSSDVLAADINVLADDVEMARSERSHQRLTVEDRLSPEDREKLWALMGKRGSLR